MIQRTLSSVALGVLAAIACGQTSNGTAPPPDQVPTLTPPVQPKVAPVQTPPPVSISPFTGPNLVGAKPIDAEDAAMIALKHQPQIALARAALQAAHGKVLIAAQLLLPGVQINSGYLQSYQLNSPPPNPNGTTSNNNKGGFTSSVDVSQLIFDFGRTVDNVRENEAFERSSGFGLSVAESDSAYAAKQAFYTYVQSLRDIDVAQANLNDSQGNLALAQARLSAGLGLPGDVVSAQTIVAQNTVALLNTKNTAAQDQISLALAMGVDPRTPLVPADSAERPLDSDDTNALVDQALKQRPDIKQQEENLRAAGYAISYAKKILLPSLSLTAGISTSGPAQPFANQFASYGVTLSWNPFDILNYRGQLDEAEAQRKQAEAQMQQAVQSVQSQVVQAYLNDKYADQQVAVSTAELANATEGLRIAEGQYRAGTVTFVTVITAQANIATARGDLVNANAQLQLARAAMEHALGKPLG